MTSFFLPQTPEQAAGAHGVGPAASLNEPPSAVVALRNGLETRLETVALGNAPYDEHLAIEVADWDVLFDAVKTTLRRIVGEQLGVMPDVPAHSAALSASLVQALVLDCVSSLDRLHAALNQERSLQQHSQHPTP